MAQPRPVRTHPGIWIAVTILLATALIGTLWVPFYNRTTPALGGFPFFYWYQLMWVPIVAILGAICYLLARVAQRGNAATGGQPSGPEGDEAS